MNLKYPQGPALTQEEAITCLLALPRGATALMIGGVDTGKTTFVREAALALSRAGRSPAVVDCDLGQSEVGPPSTIGVACLPPGLTELRSLRDFPPLACYFIGATSPVRHALEVCVGACQMARIVKKRRPDIILVDTCGWVHGSSARQFKRRLAELLLPHMVLAFGRDEEINPLLAAFGYLTAPDVTYVAMAPGVARKTPAARATRRAARFLAALEKAHIVTVAWDQVAFCGTSLGMGEPVSHHLLQFLCQSLHRPVLHAEQGVDHSLTVVVDGETWNSSGLAAVEGHFRTRAVSIIPVQKMFGLLVGLVGATGGLLNLGLIQQMDFAARTLSLLTPCRRPAAIAQVWFGFLRLRPDGRELGEIRPGEL